MSKKSCSTCKDSQSLRLKVSDLEQSLRKHEKKLGLRDYYKFWLIENQHLQLIIDYKTVELEQLRREIEKHNHQKNTMEKMSYNSGRLVQELRTSYYKILKMARHNAYLSNQVSELKKKCKELYNEAVEAKKLRIVLYYTKQSYEIRIAYLEFTSKYSKIFRSTSKSYIRHQYYTPLKKPTGSIIRQNRSTSNMKMSDSLRQLNLYLTYQNRILATEVYNLLTANSELQQKLRINLMYQRLSEYNTAQFYQIEIILDKYRKEFELKLQSKKSLIELLNRKISQQEYYIIMLSCRCYSLQSELIHFASSEL